MRVLWVEGRREGREGEDEGLEVLLVEELGRGECWVENAIEGG